MSARILILLSVLAAAVAVPSARSEPVRRPVGGDEPVLAALAQDALGLHGATGNFLDELAEALGALSTGKGGPDLDRAIENLADRASRGAEVDSFTPLVIDQLHLLGDKRPKDWRYGGVSERIQLMRYLWNKGVSLSSKDGVAAQRFAKAALVLAAHEGRALGTTLFRSFGNDFDQLRRVAGLDPEQARRVGALIAMLNAEATKFAESFKVAAEAEAAIIETHETPLPASLIDASIQAVKQWRLAAKEMKGPRQIYVCQAIATAWNLRNLVYARGDEKSRAAVDSMLKEWQADARLGSAERRVLDEALSTTVQPMTRPRIGGPGKAASPRADWGGMRHAANLFQRPLGLASLCLIGAILCFVKWRPRSRDRNARG